MLLFDAIIIFIIGVFLEKPANVECITGDDAILSCKVRFENLDVTWLKDDYKIMQNDKYTMSNVLNQNEKELRLQLKNTTTSDSGEYCVTVGTISRKLQLKINGNETVINIKFKYILF